MAKSLLAAAFVATDMKLLRATSSDCVGRACSMHESVMADIAVDEPLGLLQMRQSDLTEDVGQGEGYLELEGRGKGKGEGSKGLIPIKGKGKGKGLKGKGKGKCKSTTTGKCSMWGDPHILGFDSERQDLSLLAVPSAETSFVDHHETMSGIYWLVKSKQLQLQAKFAKVNYPNAKLRGTYMIGLAVSGPALEGNIVEIHPQNGQVFWNGEPVMKQGEEKEFAGDGVVALRAFESEDVNVNKADESVTSIEALFGHCMSLLVNRHSQHLNMRLTMPRDEAGDGLIGGYCGNFNGLPDDDNPELISAQSGSLHVNDEDDVLFRKHEKA